MNRIHVGEGIGAAAWPGLPGRDRCAEAGGPGTSSKGHLPLRDWVEEGSEGTVWDREGRSLAGRGGEGG